MTKRNILDMSTERAYYWAGYLATGPELEHALRDLRKAGENDSPRVEAVVSALGTRFDIKPEDVE